MKWIKATERLPDDPFKNVIVRHLRTREVGLGKTMGHYTHMCTEFVGWNSTRGDQEFKEIEWLDESESPSVNDPSVLKEALEKIRGLHVAKGRKGCTWGDTDCDSLSAVAGYNDALGIAKEISDKALSQYNASLPGSQGEEERALAETRESLSELIRSLGYIENKYPGSVRNFDKERLIKAKQTLAKYWEGGEPSIVKSTLPAQSGEPDTRQEEEDDPDEFIVSEIFKQWKVDDWQGEKEQAQRLAEYLDTNYRITKKP